MIFLLFIIWFRQTTFDSEEYINDLVKLKLTDKEYFKESVHRNYFVIVLEIDGLVIYSHSEKHNGNYIMQISTIKRFDHLVKQDGTINLDPIIDYLLFEFKGIQCYKYLLIRDIQKNALNEDFYAYQKYLILVQAIQKYFVSLTFEGVLIYPLNTFYHLTLNRCNHSSFFTFYGRKYYSIQLIVDKMRYFLNINSNDIKNEFIVSKYINWQGSNLKMFKNEETLKFFIDFLIVPIMMNLESKDIYYLNVLALKFKNLRKLKKVSSQSFCKFRSHYTSFFKLNKTFRMSLGYHTQITTEEINFFLEKMPETYLRSLFTFYKLISKTKVHYILFKSIMLDLNNETFDLFLKLLHDFSILELSEMEFLRRYKTTLFLHIFLERHFIDELFIRLMLKAEQLIFLPPKKACSFIMIFYLMFLRKYEEVDMKSMLDYIYNHIILKSYDIEFFKMMLNTEILNLIRNAFKKEIELILVNEKKND